MRSLGVGVYIVAWPGRSCFGFVAPLNEPHVARCVSRGFAACRGVLTSLCLGAADWGSALRGVTARLQAKLLRPGPMLLAFWDLARPCCGRSLRCALLGALSRDLVRIKVQGGVRVTFGGGRFAAPLGLHDFSSMTKKDCHFVVAVFLYCLFPCSIRFSGIMHRR